MKRLLVLSFAAILALGSFGGALAGPPDHANAGGNGKGKGNQGTTKIYHCHATGATAENGKAKYNLLHLPLAAASKGDVHGAVAIYGDLETGLLCPDDEGYGEGDEFEQDHGH